MYKRFLPTHDSIKQSRLLRWLGPRLHDPSLWRINRRAVTRGVAIGAFFGLLIPVAQIPAAALASLFWRANLWIAAVSTLISNPFTYAPLYYFAYQLGAALLGRRAGGDADLAAAGAEQAMAALPWFDNLWHWITGIGQPLALGMLVMAVAGAVAGYVIAHLAWRARVIFKRRRQRTMRALRAGA